MWFWATRTIVDGIFYCHRREHDTERSQISEATMNRGPLALNEPLAALQRSLAAQQSYPIGYLARDPPMPLPNAELAFFLNQAL